MKEENLKKILLFFFFTTLNEQRSKELARMAWFWCLDKKKKNPDLDSNHIVLLSLERSWKDIENESRTGISSFSADSGWIVDPSIRLETWKEFQKTAANEELFITVISQILGFAEKTITEVLGLSSGTIRYRLAKTSRRIGASALLHSGVRR
jgi:hypothetical protein